MKTGEIIHNELKHWIYNETNEAGAKLMVIDANDLPVIIPAIVKKLSDHGSLLKKYVRYVMEAEGIDYITRHDSRGMCDVKFTEEEWEILEGISEEVNYPDATTHPYPTRNKMKNKEWISVEDRLPKRGKVVLVHDEDGSMSISYRPKRSKSGEEAGDDGLSWYPGGRGIGFTTHWMELPDPPEVEYPNYPANHKRLLFPEKCENCDKRQTYFCKALCFNGF